MAAQLAERDLERLCWNLLRDHRLELPLDPWELCRSLGDRRGRRIQLLAADLGGPHSVGHLIAFPDRDADAILYDVAAPLAVQVQVICHEIIHLVRGHLDDQTALTCGALLRPASSTDVASGRYAQWKEWEAEFGGSILAQLVNVRPEPTGPVRGSAEAGLAAAFGLSGGGY